MADEYFADAGHIVFENNKATIGLLQRRLRIGFNRACRIMDQMEEVGVVGPEVGTSPRAILMTQQQFDEYLKDNPLGPPDKEVKQEEPVQEAKPKKSFTALTCERCGGILKFKGPYWTCESCGTSYIRD